MAGLLQATTVMIAKPMPAQTAHPTGFGEASHLPSLREIASLVNSETELTTVFDRIVGGVCRHTSWTSSQILAVDRRTGYAVRVTDAGPQFEHASDAQDRWRLATSPTLRVVETKQPVVIEDAPNCDEFPDYQADALTYGFHTVVVLPLGATDAGGRELIFTVMAYEPVAVTDHDLDFLRTIAHLASIAVDRAKSLSEERKNSERLRDTLQVNSNLLGRVLAGNSTETIVGIIQTLLPVPTIFLDFTADAAHASGSPEPRLMNDRTWLDFVVGPALHKLVRIVQETEPSDFQRAHRIDFRDLGLDLDAKAHVEPLSVNGERVGGLILFCEKRGLDDLEIVTAQEACFALGAQLMRAHIHQGRRNSQLSDLLERLFEGDWSDKRQIRNWTARLDITLPLPCVLIAIEVELPQAGGSHLLRQLERLAHSRWLKSLVIEHNELVWLCLPADEQPAGSDLAEETGRVVRLLTGRDPLIAIGGRIGRVEDFPAARSECMRLLELARQFGRTGVVRLGDFGAYALLMSGLNDGAVRSFVQTTLGRVLDYDASNGSCLLETAEAFISAGCRYQSAAEVLGIHVSTLRYRLRRLSELFEIDIEDEETRFGLGLAIRLHRISG